MARRHRRKVRNTRWQGIFAKIARKCSEIARRGEMKYQDCMSYYLRKRR